MTYRDLSELPKGSLTHDEAVSIAQAIVPLWGAARGDTRRMAAAASIALAAPVAQPHRLSGGRRSGAHGQ